MKLSSVALCLLLSASLLSGCAGTRESRIGSDTSDACYQYRVALDATGNYFEEDLIKGAVGGAVLGALAGGLLTGSWEGAAAGAVTGAIAGAAAGYWNYQQERQQDTAVLYNNVLSDIEVEAGRITETEWAMSQLVDCREQQADQIIASYRAGQIDAVTARAQMAEVRAKAEGDLSIAQNIQEDIGERTEQLEFAAYQVNPQAENRVKREADRVASRPTTRPPRQTQPRQQQLSEARAKQEVTEPTVRMLAGQQKIDNHVGDLQQVAQGEGKYSDNQFAVAPYGVVRG